MGDQRSHGEQQSYGEQRSSGEQQSPVTGSVTCRRCGHVTPHLEGWMVAAVVHHLVAVHGERIGLLKRR